MFFLVKKVLTIVRTFRVIIESVNVMQTIRSRVKDRIDKVKQNVDAVNWLNFGIYEARRMVMDHIKTLKIGSD